MTRMSSGHPRPTENLVKWEQSQIGRGKQIDRQSHRTMVHEPTVVTSETPGVGFSLGGHSLRAPIKMSPKYPEIDPSIGN
jgi:hypothetical protein